MLTLSWRCHTRAKFLLEAIKNHQLHQNLFEIRKKELDDLQERLFQTQEERDEAQDSLDLKEKELREASWVITDKDRMIAQMREQLNREADLDDDRAVQRWTLRSQREKEEKEEMEESLSVLQTREAQGYGEEP